MTAVSAGHAKDGIHSSRETNRSATRGEYSGIWPSFVSLKRCELGTVIQILLLTWSRLGNYVKHRHARRARLIYDELV